MRIALVVNEASGGGTDPAPLERAMREHGAEVETFGCETEDLERIPGTGPDRVVVAGGDGTVGAVAELAGRLGVPLGVIPAGTANDFVRANGLPLDPVEAAVLAASGQELRSLELGRLGDGRPFVNVASAGLASVAARRAAPLKPRLGPLAYGVGAVRAAATASPLRVHGARRRPDRLLRRRLAGHPRRHGRVRRRLGRRRRRPGGRRARRRRHPRAARGSGSPAAPGASSATRSPSSAAWSTTAAT